MIDRLPVPLARLVYRVGYVVLRLASLVLRPRTRGVKCLVFHGDDLLLVRHTYGPRHWDIPGGFCRRGESFDAAAHRELAEELGIEGARWTSLGDLDRRHQRRREMVGALRADVAGREVTLQPAEIEAARWFPRAALPDDRAEIVDLVLEMDTPPR